jgi:hypothetical protein
VTLDDRQRSFNGYVLGKPGPWGIVSEEGLDDLAVFDGDRPMPLFDGSIPGVHLTQSKTVILRLVTSGVDRDVAEANVTALENATRAMRASEAQYVFKQPNKPERFVWARPIRRVRPRTQETEHGPVFADLVLKVADPHTYGIDQRSLLIPVYSISGGGFEWPIVDWPIDLGAATSQVAVAVNAGNTDAYPLLRFQRPASSTGDVFGVTLTNTTSGDDPLVLVVEIAPGQTLTVDMFAYTRAKRDVEPIHIDGASRFSGWQHPRVPFRLLPGSNTLRMDVDGTTSDLVGLATWRDTFIS